MLPQSTAIESICREQGFRLDPADPPTTATCRKLQKDNHKTRYPAKEEKAVVCGQCRSCFMDYCTYLGDKHKGHQDSLKNKHGLCS